MPLRFWLSASPFCVVEGGLQAVFFAERGLVLVADRLDDLGQLVLQLGVRGFDRGADLDHLRVPFAVALGELRLLALQIGQVRLELLDVVVGEDRGKVSSVPEPSADFNWL